MTPPSHPNAPRALAIFTAGLLALVLFESILTVWIETPWNLALAQTAVLTLAAVWFLWELIRPYRVRLHPILLPLAAPILIGVAQLLTHLTVARWQTGNAVLLWAVYLSVFWLALQLGAFPDVHTHLLRALLYFGFAFSVVSVLAFYSETQQVFGIFDAPYPDPYLGPFTNKDHYAAFIELILPLALYFALSRRARLIPGAAMAGMLFASVIAGASRAGSFLVTCEIVVVLLLAARRRLPSLQTGRRSALRPVVLILALIAVFTFALGYARLWSRIQEPDPYLGRSQILHSTREMFLQRPLTGFGLGAFEIAYPPFAHYDDGSVLTHAHNDWVEWAVTGGLPLLLILLAIPALGAASAWRSLWGLGVFSVFLHCLIDYPLNRPAIALWLFVLFGLCVSRPPDKISPAF